MLACMQLELYSERMAFVPAELLSSLAPQHFTTCAVEAVGPGVTQLKPGDRVALEPGVPCCAHHQYRQGRGKRAARLHVGAAIS